MTNAVGFARSAGVGLVNRTDLAKSLNNMAMTMPRVGGDKQFLKLDKGNGEWFYGQEETPVEEGAQWAVNPASFLHGYISWDRNQQVEGEVMVSINRPLPNDSELRVQGSPDGRPTGQNGWQYQMAVDMVCISGEDTGTVIQYKQSSVGAIKAFNELTNAIAGQLAADKDEIVPIIVMKSDSYKHKKYGRIFNPIFEVVEFRTMDDGSAPASDTPKDDKPKEDTSPARSRTRGAAAPDPKQDVPDDEAEDAELEAQYKAEQASTEQAAPRRRTRR